jgi:hypothetical protein
MGEERKVYWVLWERGNVEDQGIGGRMGSE